MGPARPGRDGPSAAVDPRDGVRIVQVSDTHLSHLGGVTTANFTRLAAFIDDVLRPDLVVHTGDVIAVSPDAGQDRAAARALLGALRAPVRVLPGNHDVGEPGPAPWMGIEVTSRRVAAHRAVFGPDRFCLQLGDWAVLGLNSELLGSGLPEEEEQWSWLTAQLGALRGGPAVAFLHRPLWPHRPAEEGPSRGVLEPARSRLLSLPGAADLRAVGSGHLHRYRRRERPELLEVWAPSTAFRGRTRPGTSHFEQLGVVEWWLGADGAVDAWFRAPVGLDERETEAVPEVADAMAALETGLSRPGAGDGRAPAPRPARG